jgi:ribonuclease-3
VGPFEGKEKMITFNSAYQNDENDNYASVKNWLGMIYKVSEKRNEFILAEISSTISSYNTLQDKLGYTFKNQQLLILALTHKTFHFEFKNLISDDNEKLEFLGDSIVNFLFSEVLFEQFPHLSEGELSKLRVSLVNENSFYELAKSLNLSSNIRIGFGEFKNAGLEKPVVLADAFEALMAAIYIDSQSIVVTKNVLQKIVQEYESSSNTKFIQLNAIDDFDSKSKLQEFVMAKYSQAPVYKSTENNNEFEVELWVDKKLILKMKGPSKKKIEKELAKKVLDNKLI